MATPLQVEHSARASLKAAYDKYPMGCDEDQMKAFLATQEYPEVAWSILNTTDEWPEVVKKYADQA